MKELSQFVLGKVLFASVKEHLFFTKRALRQSREAGAGGTPLTGSYF